MNEQVRDKTEIVLDKLETVKSEGEHIVQPIIEQAVEKAQQIEETIEHLPENVEQKADVVSESITDKAETVLEKVETAENDVEQIVQPIIEQAVEKAQQIEETIEHLPENVEQKADAVIESIRDKAETVLEKVEIAENDVEQIVQPIIEETVGKVQQAEETVEQFTEQKVDELDENITDKSETVLENVEETVENAEKESSADVVQSKAEYMDDYQEKPERKGGFFNRLIKGLIKTKQQIGSGFLNFFKGKKIDDELFEELEEQLLVADLGMPTTTKIINNLTQHATKQQLRDAELLYQQLKLELADVLKPVAQPLVLEDKKPYVILMVGVNGVGKTTTIGKLARKFQAEGKSVMLAAGDTFRAAAVEQLQVWGERNQIPVVAQTTGSDAASVIFDAMQSAAAKGIDVLIADTAGRLQNKNNLMDELKKIVRVMKKYDETAPHEIMLTLDAGTGQNAISQAKLFNEAVGLTGITLTKLDGTAKGGVIFAIADQFNIPIRFIGVGEKIEDLRSFNADEFIEALFTHEDEK
ncbi:signal recognition particle-docking protein FtsY [Vespertiliibacter pulmonis]|uniref:signal recognition particle-docking protein FtsY n=1 Tax=Vespertiliibacter pulmonis TaxID=1443036 RepID=UPI003D160151